MAKISLMIKKDIDRSIVGQIEGRFQASTGRSHQ